jgi:hypothetical protein
MYMQKVLFGAAWTLLFCVALVFVGCLAVNDELDPVNAATPVITAQPQSASYIIDLVATALSVTATTIDGGALTYQWYSNTANSNSGGTAIVGETKASYIPSTKAADTGTLYYYVVVTNTNNSATGTKTATATSIPAEIIVDTVVHTVTPQITAQPQSASYIVDQVATALSVTATASDGGILTYQWYRNEADSNSDGTALTGETDASYTPPTMEAGTVYYYVVVTNKNSVDGAKSASVASNRAVITVIANANVTLAILPGYLDSLPANTAAPYHTVALDKSVFINTADTSAIGVWATINRTVQAKKKYVILDISQCTAMDATNANTIAGDYSPSGKRPSGNHFNIIKDNTYIKGVILPATLISIGDSAFSECTSLTSVNIGDSVTSIGDYAFRYCSSLACVTIPSSVTSIGNYAFRYSGFTSVTIPSSVTTIGSQAFSDCTSLTSVTIEDGVTSIGDYAFSDCTSLTSVTIPSSVTSIGDHAFAGCSKLTSVTITGNTVTSTVGQAFRNLTSFTVTIEGSVTSIGSQAFRDCSKLTSVTIGDSVTTIGDSAFAGCSGLTSVTIGDSVTSIGDYAFRYCSSLTRVTIPSSVTSIGNSAFAGCSGLTSVTIPKGASIGDSAFSDCSGLASVTIGDGVTIIGDHAFAGCSKLTSVTIKGNTVTSTVGQTFRTLTSFTVTIGDSVTSIGDGAFAGCSGLASVTFNGVITSGNFSTYDSFPGDLRAKYLSGGVGTYTCTPGSSSPVWTKQ